MITPNYSLRANSTAKYTYKNEEDATSKSLTIFTMQLDQIFFLLVYPLDDKRKKKSVFG